MTPPASGPSGTTLNGSGGWTPPDTSQQRLQLDNLLRRELKIADPSDANEIAKALLARYQGTARARSIEQEARGLPYLPAPIASPSMPTTTVSTASSELDEALKDVERDLRELTTNAAFKDVTPELEGWAQAIRDACREGASAARFGLDPRQRDKAMAIRRQLCDYARMARIVGTLTPHEGGYYRSLARSLDEVSAVLLVLVGETLASVGMNGGQFLLQAPFSELQVRRDAAVYALRNLTGATQEAYGPQDWPRGLNAYRQLFDVLETGGHSDLRSLLVEGELVRVMDRLIERAGQGSAQGLRALGATAQLDLARFHRLAIIGQTAVDPESPPLSAFLEALRLFADAFTAAGGYRLLRIARPPILFYGLYERGGTDAAEARLIRLVSRRGELAEHLDCLLGCSCTPEAKRWQIALDMVLYQVDRAVDLYALGTEPFGLAERRAAAYGYVIQFLVDHAQAAPIADPPLRKHVADALALCAAVRDEGLWPLPRTLLVPDDTIRALRDYAEAIAVELAARGKAQQAAAIRNQLGQFPDPDNNQPFADRPLKELTDFYNLLEDSQALLVRAGGSAVPTPDVVDVFLGVMHDELCVQSEIEKRWRGLVRQMAPGCYDPEQAMEFIVQVMSGALGSLGERVCEPIRATLPPHFETSWDGLVNAVDKRGFNR